MSDRMWWMVLVIAVRIVGGADVGGGMVELDSEWESESLIRESAREESRSEYVSL